MVASESPPGGLIAVAAVTAGFGAITVALLLLAWLRPRAYLASMAIAVAVVIVWLSTSFDGGSIVGLEAAGLVVIAALSFVCAATVRTITRRRLTRR